ncbi:MAG: nuclear transport factor 2 family protein [Steroidobacteraceae bacterium]
MTDDADLFKRLDRIESQLAIQQLPMRYALAIDSRDLDAWVQLFVEDVDCGSHGVGRDALKRFIDPNVRTFYRSHHQICGQVVDFIDDDHATGKVYCRAEHEARGQWIVMAICYFDTYERRHGRWFFVKRSEKHWYSTDILERPTGPNFQRWDLWRDRKPALPHFFPTWRSFWEKSDPSLLKELSSEP